MWTTSAAAYMRGGTCEDLENNRFALRLELIQKCDGVVVQNRYVLRIKF